MRSVKHLRNNKKGTPRRGYINIMKPDLATKQSVASLSILTSASRSPTSRRKIILSPRKRRVKTG